MGYYQKNLSDFATSAIEMQESKTLKVIDRFESEDDLRSALEANRCE